MSLRYLLPAQNGLGTTPKLYPEFSPLSQILIIWLRTPLKRLFATSNSRSKLGDLPSSITSAIHMKVDLSLLITFLRTSLSQSLCEHLTSARTEVEMIELILFS